MPEKSSSAPFWKEPRPLVLGSGSAARRALLEACGIPIRIIRPDTDESAIAAGQIAAGASPLRIAEQLALAKSQAIARTFPGEFILTADQTLDHHGTLMMKAGTTEQLRAQLRRLRGSAHELHSAAVLRRGETVLWRGVASARLVMRDFSESFLESYVEAGGAALLDTVGGYHMEKLGTHLFAEVSGEHATILGLPLRSVLEALRQIGALET